MESKEIVLDIVGVGIVFYSPSFVKNIKEGEDYLSSHYTTEEQVQSHIQRGTIVGFGTGTPGRFLLKLHGGYPEEAFLQACEFKLRLGLHCVGGLLCFRDLYDLAGWSSQCPAEQTLTLDDGFYHVTLCSDAPSSGILGDNQRIGVFLQRLDAFPRLATEGIPTLCF